MEIGINNGYWKERIYCKPTLQVSNMRNIQG